MKIAIPISDGKLSPHFGHCDEFALIDVDMEAKNIQAEARVPSPPHQPGLLPQWLAQQKVNLIIAGGMGGRAIDLFEQHQIGVVIGAALADPLSLARAYLEGSLNAGDNLCDHGA